MKHLMFFESYTLNEAKTSKIFTIIKTRRGKDRETTGTLEELINYFSYTLECGNSWNKKINKSYCFSFYHSIISSFSFYH